MAQKSRGKGKKKQFQSKFASKPSTTDTPTHSDTPCLFSMSIGTHNACLATIKNSSLEVVVNENGDRLTPAFISYEPISGKQGQLRPLIGQVASQSADRGESNCFSQLLEIRNELGNSQEYKIVTDTGTRVMSHGKILTDFISAVRDTVSAYCNKTATHCIIAHSSQVSMDTLDTLRNACVKASLIPLQILPSNAFPLLAYEIGQNEKDFEVSKIAIVMDIGHKYAEVAIFRISHGLFQPIEVARYEDLGGEVFTQLLTEHVITNFNNKYKCDVNTSKKAVLKITRVVTQAKHILSTLPNASIDIDSLFNDIDCHLEISRGRFEALISPLISRILERTLEMLSHLELESSSVTNVVCVGGSCRIPMIQSQLQARFSAATIHATLPPDEVVAISAAKQCQILELSNAVQDFVQSNYSDTIACITYDLILNINTDQLVFKSGTSLPATKVTTLEVSSDELTFSIYENIKQIGTETLSIPSGVKIVSLKAELNHTSGLHVSFSDMTSGQIIDTFHVVFNSVN